MQPDIAFRIALQNLVHQCLWALRQQRCVADRRQLSARLERFNSWLSLNLNEGIFPPLHASCRGCDYIDVSHTRQACLSSSTASSTTALCHLVSGRAGYCIRYRAAGPISYQYNLLPPPPRLRLPIPEVPCSSWKLCATDVSFVTAAAWVWIRALRISVLHLRTTCNVLTKRARGLRCQDLQC